MDLLSQDFTGFQIGAKLMKEAMAGQPARVPVYAQIHEFAAHQLGIPALEFYMRPELMVPAILEIEARFRLDIASITYDVYNIEAEGLGQNIIFPREGSPDIDRGQPLVHSSEDLHRIRTPDFECSGRFSNVIHIHTLFNQLTGLAPTLRFTAPFSLAASLFGIERLVMAIYTDPDFARNLLDRLTEEVIAPWILYQRYHFPQSTSIVGADAIASLPLINMTILHHWVVPYILRLRELCGQEVYVANWIGERLLREPEDMLELKRLVCPGWVQGQDPDVEKLGPSFYKDYAVRNNLGLSLGVGASFLSQGTPLSVVERVRSYVLAGKPGGRFALYLCNLDASTPPENLRAAVETVHDVGVY